MAGDRVQALVFGEVAAEYDRVRPGYPPELIDTVLGNTPADPTALDVGAGTGKATAMFAAKGVRITALEPDPAMALILRSRVTGVNIAMATLESHLPESQYDLVYSAQAFHWAAPETRGPQVAAALRPGGTLALFWNYERAADPAVRRKMFSLLHEHVPVLAPSEEEPSEEDLAGYWPRTELSRLPELGQFEQRLFRWQRELSRADYLVLVTTHSGFRMLDEELGEEIVAELEALLPDQVVVDVSTQLFLAKKL